MEAESGLTCGEDFTVGYSPERINPGDKVHTVDKIIKVVAGSDSETTSLLAAVYGLGRRLGGWRAGEILLGVALLIPALLTLHTVVTRFTVKRAAGGDHFRESYLSMPMIREGMFRWSPNSMYSFAFLGLWSSALIAGSWQALVVAFFQHAYVWVHMYTVEAPDMRWLYGSALEERRGAD